MRKKEKLRWLQLFKRFEEEVFLWVLLPPIILSATYHLGNREFLNQIDGIMLFAVIGTMANIFLLGGTLYGLEKAGMFSYNLGPML